MVILPIPLFTLLCVFTFSVLLKISDQSAVLSLTSTFSADAICRQVAISCRDANAFDAGGGPPVPTALAGTIPPPGDPVTVPDPAVTPVAVLPVPVAAPVPAAVPAPPTVPELAAVPALAALAALAAVPALAAARCDVP